MDDVISRQAALDCVTYDVEYTTERIKALPSLQPTCNQLATDCISRQAAIDGVKTLHEVAWKNWHEPTLSANVVIDMIKDLSSVHPEIVRCKECKWYELPSHKITENCVRWMKSNGILLPIKPNDYCSYAERRTDEGSD